MKLFLPSSEIESGFLQEVERRSGQKVAACYQCGKCSAGCPLFFAMDYPPNQVIRMVQLGMREAVLSSRSIWLCASCETCSTRCPQEVDLVGIMDALRRMACAEGIEMKEKDVPLFNEIFLENIRRHGRVFEMAMMGTYNLRSGRFLKDVLLAPRMFLKGKLSLLPPRIKDIKGIREIFAKAGELEGR